MKNTENVRVLIVGRSPSVLMTAVEMLRDKGYRADVTNQFDRVLTDYDPAGLDIVVFGGMVPPETKQHLREEFTARHPGITVLQGLSGIPGLITAQVEEAVHGGSDESADIGYDPATRTVRLTLEAPAHVTVTALWGTSFTPPEPKSTSEQLFDGGLGAGDHAVALPEQVPDVASFAAVRIDSRVRVLTIGGMPQAVRRMVPASAEDRRLPGVAAVTTHGEDPGDTSG